MSVWHALMQDLAPADSHEAGFHAARLELWDIMRRAVVTGLAVSMYIYMYPYKEKSLLEAWRADVCDLLPCIVTKCGFCRAVSGCCVACST